MSPASGILLWGRNIFLVLPRKPKRKGDRDSYEKFLYLSYYREPIRVWFFLSSQLNYDLALKPTPSQSSKWCILFTWHPQRFFKLCEQIPRTLSSAAIPTGRNLIGSCLPFAKCRYLIIDQIRLIHSTVAMAGFYRLTFCS